MTLGIYQSGTDFPFNVVGGTSRVQTTNLQIDIRGPYNVPMLGYKFLVEVYFGLSQGYIQIPDAGPMGRLLIPAGHRLTLLGIQVPTGINSIRLFGYNPDGIQELEGTCSFTAPEGASRSYVNITATQATRGRSDGGENDNETTRQGNDGGGSVERFGITVHGSSHGRIRRNNYRRSHTEEGRIPLASFDMAVVSAGRLR